MTQTTLDPQQHKQFLESTFKGTYQTKRKSEQNIRKPSK